MDRIYNFQKAVMQGKTKYKYIMSIMMIIPPILGVIVPFFFYDVLGHKESHVVSQIVTGTLVPMLCASFSVMQKYQLLGRFGDSIILLVPTFVWLLPEYEEVIDIMLYVAMGLCAIMIILYFATISLIKDKNIERGARASMITAKLKYTIASILVALSLSFILIQGGDAGMDGLDNAKGTPDNSGESGVMFVGIIAVALIFLMVLEGMFHDLLVIKYHDIDNHTTEITLEAKEKIKELKAQSTRRERRLQRLEKQALELKEHIHKNAKSIKEKHKHKK